jgi:integrase
MPAEVTVRTPGYRRQRRKGKPDLAFVEFDGQRHYLGTYDTPDSRRRYATIIAEWQAAGYSPPVEVDALTITELVDRYWTHAKAHYRKPDGAPTSELDLVRRALDKLVNVYGDLAVNDFSPLKLKAVRDAMIRSKWCRKVVNDMTHRVKRLFRWAVENEMAPASVDHALRTVSGLKRGRSDARESDPVLPVPEEWINETLKHVSPQVEAMIRLQLLTGARPGEICSMRQCDIARKGKVWNYTPYRYTEDLKGCGLGSHEAAAVSGSPLSS